MKIKDKIIIKAALTSILCLMVILATTAYAEDAPIYLGGQTTITDVKVNGIANAGTVYFDLTNYPDTRARLVPSAEGY